MVDSGAEVGGFLGFGADPFGQHPGGALDGVAESGDVQFREFALHAAAEHCHRVGVVEHDGVPAVAADILADVEHDRERPHGAEDSRRSPGVSDIDVDLVFHRNFDVGPEHLRPALQDGDDDAVGVFQSLLAVHGCEDFGRIVAGGDNFFDGLLDEGEPLFIDVHECDFRVAEGFKAQNVPDQSPGEAEAAGSDECDFFCHFDFPDRDCSSGANAGFVTVYHTAFRRVCNWKKAAFYGNFVLFWGLNAIPPFQFRFWGTKTPDPAEGSGVM